MGCKPHPISKSLQGGYFNIIAGGTYFQYRNENQTKQKSTKSKKSAALFKNNRKNIQSLMDAEIAAKKPHEEISAMKHDCQETEPLLSGYLDGELTQFDQQRVDLILEDCRQCKSYIFTILRNNLKKYNNNILIELGSYHGDTTKAAIGFGYKKVFTCELQPHLYEICKQNLNTEIANKLVDLRLSDSRDFF